MSLKNLDKIDLQLNVQTGKFYYIDGNGQFAEFTIPSASQNGYYTYIANVTQSGTSNPVATVLFNNTGRTITWTRDSIGVYRATPSGSSISTSTNGFCTSSGLSDVSISDAGVLIPTYQTTYIKFTSFSVIDQAVKDEMLNNTTIIINFLTV